MTRGELPGLRATRGRKGKEAERVTRQVDGEAFSRALNVPCTKIIKARGVSSASVHLGSLEILTRLNGVVV